jgi:hypothetical protein
MFDTKPYDRSADSPIFPRRSRVVIPSSGPLSFLRKALIPPTTTTGGLVVVGE